MAPAILTAGVHADKGINIVRYPDCRVRKVMNK